MKCSNCIKQLLELFIIILYVFKQLFDFDIIIFKIIIFALLKHLCALLLSYYISNGTQVLIYWGVFLEK